MNSQAKEKLTKLLKKTDFDDAYTAELLTLGLTSLSELVDPSLRVVSVQKLTELTAGACASQKVHGPVNACALLLGDVKDLRKVAEQYAGAQFIETYEDALDADCELINCINGKFTKLFQEAQMEEEMEPPFFRVDPSIVKGDAIYAVTVYLAGVKVIYGISHNTGIEGV